MDPYDTKSTRAVWTRVLQTTHLPEMPLVSPESELLAMIEGERKACSVYRCLARKGGCHAKRLEAMAAQEAAHARRLEVLYVLLTGQKVAPTPCVVENSANLRDSLHRCYLAELSSVRTYCDAARQRPEHAPLFYALAREERQHSRSLHAMASRLL